MDQLKVSLDTILSKNAWVHTIEKVDYVNIPRRMDSYYANKT